jgi:ParB family chromosome partitioning protein
VPIELIDANPHQPRHAFQSDALDDLVSSIRQHGIIQPLVMTRNGSRYTLIAGERRLRAAKQVGLQTVPGLVRDSAELEQLEIAIVENVQREDLNPVEEALAYQQLSEEFGMTQDQISHKVGKSRASVANAIRLLSLPPEMLSALREGRITPSHGKVLLAAVTPNEREELFKQITQQSLPVRAAGSLGRTTTVRRYARRNVDPLVRADEDQLRSHFGTKVKITKRDQRGSITFEFYSEEDYRQLLDRFQSS